MGELRNTVASRATIDSRVDFNRVHTFVAVADAGSFTAAAASLGVPKSSVSRAVSKLERELGITLLQRTTRKLALTSAGKAYLERARTAVALLSEGQAVAREAVDAPSGTVRITAPHDPGGKLLAEPIASFVQQYPSVRVDIVFSARRLDLLEEEIDLAVRGGRLDDASLAGRRIGFTPFWLVAAPSYIAARGAPRRLAQLAQHDCVLYRAVGGSARWTLERRGKGESVTVHGPIAVDDLAFAVHLARLGIGITLAPSTFVLEPIASGELVRVLPQYEQETAALYIVHLKNRKLPRRVALLRDHLVERLRKAGGLVPSGPGRP